MALGSGSEVTFDASGISIDGGQNAQNQVKWYDGASLIAKQYGFVAASKNYFELDVGLSDSTAEYLVYVGPLATGCKFSMNAATSISFSVDNQTFEIFDHGVEATGADSGTALTAKAASGATYVQTWKNSSDGAGLQVAANALDLVIDTTTGTKIGTATSQKIGLWNVTPIIQPASANQAALTNSTGGSADGTLAAVSGSGDDANINNNFTDIYTLITAMRTAMVDTGLMKGAA